MTNAKIVTFILLSFSIHPMEEYQRINPQLDYELKANIMLFFAYSINQPTAETFISFLKCSIAKEQDMMNVFNNNIIFTEKLIKIINKKLQAISLFKINIPFGSEIPKESQLAAIALKLKTNASLQILKNQYQSNPDLFISMIVFNISSPPRNMCAKKFLKFARSNFEHNDLVKLLLFKKTPNHPYTLLFYAIRLKSHEIIKLILKIAHSNLSPKKKHSFINTSVAGKTALDLAKFYESKLELENPKNWQEDRFNRVSFLKIINLLQKHGAIEKYPNWWRIQGDD